MNVDVICPYCGVEIEAEDSCRGHRIECPNCAKSFVCLPQEEEQRRSPAIKEYKVLTQKDKWFSGKFDPEKLEGAINAYARQGWRFVGCATASVPGVLSGPREEMVVIMERD